MPQTLAQIEQFFTRTDGTYLCARWGRPIVPVVFGVDDATLSIVKGAIEAVVTLAGHKMSDLDPEQGANLMVFFCRDWSDLAQVPDLEGLVPGSAAVLERLTVAQANQYRAFRFDAGGAIRACFVFLRIDDALAGLPAETLALAQAVQMILSWSDRAFKVASPLGLLKGAAVIKPMIADTIRAAYDPVLPAVATDSSHALRLCARMTSP